MDQYFKRLATFASWPNNLTLSTIMLAQAGFFYTQKKDIVKCFHCEVQIGSWTDSDKPILKHVEHSPKCSFAQRILRELNSEEVKKEQQALTSQNVKFDTNERLPSVPKETGKSSENKPLLQPVLNLSTERSTRLQPLSNRHDYSSDEHVPSQAVPDATTESPRSTIYNNEISTTVTNPPPSVTDESQPDSVIPPVVSTDYTIAENRLASFGGGIWRLDSPVTVSDLVVAGLYFTGPEDRVQCAWCRGGLYNWEEGDTPMDEHRKHFPQCPFVQSMANLPQNMTGNPARNMVVENNQRERTVNHRDVNEEGSGENWQSFRAVKIVSKMGYSLEMIEKAVQVILSKSNTVTSAELLDVISEMESAQQQGRDTTINTESSNEGAVGNTQHNIANNISELSLNDKKDVHHKATIRAQNSSVKEQRSENTQSGELLDLTEENDRLKNTTLCKICLDSTVNLLFLPCRHLVCCDECGEAISQCPLCRAVIVGTIKTYLS